MNYRSILLFAVIIVQMAYGTLDAREHIEQEPFEIENQHARFQFTYLDIVNPNIVFQPTFFMNKTTCQDINGSQFSYPIFGFDLETIIPLPGYQGRRCIIEVEMAKQLSTIEEELEKINPNYRLKIFDAYRPLDAVQFQNSWALAPEIEFIKKHHHPHINKPDLLGGYIARRSSHSLGTAVDVTIIDLTSVETKKAGFLGIFDEKELDMGDVGFLAFDHRAHHDYEELSETAINNRRLLLHLMEKYGFNKLRTEFWHYFYKRERNTETIFNFQIRDDYTVKDGVIVL